MCRYAQTNYKPHLACFNCRKTFKRRLLYDINKESDTLNEAKCPQCGALMADMGLDFASPKKDDIKKWELLKKMFTVGITFHSCGCSGPGYIPTSSETLTAYFYTILENYHQELDFWRNNVGQKKENEIEQAKQYWLNKINEVEQKLKVLLAASKEKQK